MKIDLTIVIPTYNEENRILKTLKAYTSFFDKRLNCEYIISDHSTDNTRKIVKDFMKKGYLLKKHKNIYILGLSGKGKGIAIIEAFKIAKGELVGFTDADNSTPPEEFFKLYQNLKGYDVVIGSRRLIKSDVVIYHTSPLRRSGSFCLGLVVRILFGLNIKDTQCGAKIFRREKIYMVIPKMRIKNSIFDVELLWRLNKIGKIKEVPIKWIDDKFSHFKWKDVIWEFIWLIRVRFGI